MAQLDSGEKPTLRVDHLRGSLPSFIPRVESNWANLCWTEESESRMRYVAFALCRFEEKQCQRLLVLVSL